MSMSVDMDMDMRMGICVNRAKKARLRGFFRFIAPAVLGVLLIPAAVPAENIEKTDAPKPDDFAYGFTITASKSGALYKIELPDACLSLSVDQNTADIAVFNADSTLLPSAPHHPTATFKSEQIPARITTALWAADEEESVSPAQSTIIIVDKDRLAAAPLEEARQKAIIPTAYLALLPEGGLTLTGIRVRWKADQLTQIVRVRVECAADLSQDAWQMLADGPLAQVVDGGSLALESVRFSLPGTRTGRYLKISFPELKTAPELLSVDVDAQRSELPEFKTLTTTLRPADNAEARPEQDMPAAVFELDLAARKWVNSLELTPVSPVIWRNAVLLGRDNIEQSWRELRALDLFRIASANAAAGTGDVCNSALVFQAELPRFLRIEIPAAAKGKSDLKFDLSYLQPGLIFQAQDPAPYTLACGSGTARASADIDQALLSLSGFSAAGVDENRRELGGDAALLVPTPEEPVDNVRMALWAVLALGVAALGGMIFILYRNMKKGK